MKRSQLGLTGAELALRADISPSYVSLIEKGAKVPDERVAARIARALRDDEELYRAWAQASRVGLDGLNLMSRMEAISRSPDHLKAVERGELLPPEPSFAESEEDALEMTAESLDPDRDRRPDDPAPPTGGPDVLRVPVLAERADPGRIAPSPLAVESHLLVDGRLVADHPLERLFAYEVTARDMKHLRGVAAPGDRIVFRRGGRVSADRVCAVRTPAGILLSRVLFKGRSLLLLPGEGEPDFDSVEVEGLRALPGIIAGTHVLLLRR
jgi:transcriptional regulator with XRE-family HTH domain